MTITESTITEVNMCPYMTVDSIILVEFQCYNTLCYD